MDMVCGSELPREVVGVRGLAALPLASEVLLEQR